MNAPEARPQVPPTRKNKVYYKLFVAYKTNVKTMIVHHDIQSRTSHISKSLINDWTCAKNAARKKQTTRSLGRPSPFLGSSMDGCAGAEEYPAQQAHPQSLSLLSEPPLPPPQASGVLSSASSPSAAPASKPQPPPPASPTTPPSPQPTSDRLGRY